MSGIEITVTTFSKTGETSFEATGTVEGQSFLARTIVYRGEPIFKVQETNDKGELALKRLDDSQFSRGQRIAVARRLRQIRLDGGLPAEDFNSLSVKELKTRCRELGVTGHSARGVRKADLVALLAA